MCYPIAHVYPFKALLNALSGLNSLQYNALFFQIYFSRQSFQTKKKKNINLNFSATVIYIKAQWLANLVPASQIPIYHFIPLHMNHFSHSFLSLHLPAKLSVQQHYLTHTTESLEKNKEGKHKLIFHSMSSQVYT